MTVSSASSRTRRSPARELTLRGVLIGGVITLVFTAANVYLGLKVGLTFATSIPAAVISMAVLRFFRDHTVVENNIVQTVASAAGTLSSIIFVLPGLVIVGYWTGFPYWTTTAVCLVGGVLGVMYSIPLRRAMVTHSDLPYPEGIAGAEVLRVGDSAGAEAENRAGFRAILIGSIASAGFALLTAAQLVAGGLTRYFRVRSGGSTVTVGFSLALIGVGHLVGLSVGVAMVVGLVLSYGVLLPRYTAGHLPRRGDIADAVDGVFAGDVRFVGAGVIAVAAVWTLLKLISPIGRGIVEAVRSTRDRRDGQDVDTVERDLPMTVVGGVTLAAMVPVGLLLWGFTRGTALASGAAGIVLVGVIYVLLVGLLVAAVCGYMAGLIGSSNSPISGVGILVALTTALLIKAVHGSTDGPQATTLVAYTLFTSAVVFGIATISNDNLQDLKTGQLVGATPWKQQVALIIGVVFGSLVIPPVMGLMNSAFGFTGAPGAGSGALNAPQASLISTLVKGVFGNSLDWGLLGTGALIGAAVIVVDEVLTRRSRFGLPPLAVGMGMYLPIAVTLVIPVGAVLGALYERWAGRRPRPEASRRLGVLLATGLIVGESLFGVLLAGIIAATGNETPLALVVAPSTDGSDPRGPLTQVVSAAYVDGSQWIGLVAFTLVVLGLYRWLQRRIRRDHTDPAAR